MISWYDIMVWYQQSYWRASYLLEELYDTAASEQMFLAYAHTTRTDSLDLVSVAKEFVSSNSRRLNYFGKF